MRGRRSEPGRPAHARRSARARRPVTVTVVAVVTVAVLVGALALTGRLGRTQSAEPPPASPAVASATLPAPEAGESVTSASATTAPVASADATTPAPPADSTAPVPPAPPGGIMSGKKGVSTWEFAGVGAALRDVGASWYWNWAAGPTPGAGDSAEFVPMIWGAGSVTSDNLARARRSGTVLLGFNEPDFASQSNMSVEQALDLWPQLQATGMRLGSPAPAVGAADPGGWLDRFLTGAAQRGYRVDFIALHWYGSDFSAAAVGHLRSYLEAVWERYHLPIWLTEFALIRWGPSGAVYPTEAEQVRFIQGATAMLEQLSFVERYAWFALPTSDEHEGTGLYRDGPTPTAAGLAYRQAGR